MPSESANLFCKGPEGDSSRLRRPHGHDSHHSGLLLRCRHGHGQDVRVPIKLYLQTQAGAGVCRPCVRQGHAASFSSPFLHSDPRATLANGFNLQEHKRVRLLLVRRGPPPGAWPHDQPGQDPLSPLHSSVGTCGHGRRPRLPRESRGGCEGPTRRQQKGEDPGLGEDGASPRVEVLRTLSPGCVCCLTCCVGRSEFRTATDEGRSPHRGPWRKSEGGPRPRLPCAALLEVGR